MELPTGAYLKDISATYNQFTIPRALKVLQPLPPETWGQVVVTEGELNLTLAGQGSQRVVAGQPALIPPGTLFKVDATDKPCVFCLHYYHEPELTNPQELTRLLGRGTPRRASA
ncbi:MAG TPA: DUF1971 domain-containing protein [bacterium]|nr:DUF1971 domain-containing protein [bacterium]